MTDLASPPPLKRRTREEARVEKRRHILDAARAVFQRLGYEGASMNDIVAEARVSKPTLYVYFDSKEGLFAALAEDLRERQPEGGLTLKPDAGNVEEALRQFGYGLVRKVTSPEVISMLRMVIGAADKVPEIGRILYQSGPCRGHDMVLAFLEYQIARGRFEIEDPSLAAWQFLDLMQQPHVRKLLLNVAEPPSPAAARDTVDKAVAMFMRGYGVPQRAG